MTYFMLFIQLAVTVVLVIWVRTVTKRFINSDNEIQKVRREIGALIQELNASSDRNISILEDRTAQLKLLVDKAESSIQAMAKEQTTRRKETLVYDRLGQAHVSEKPSSDAPQARKAAAPETTGLPFIRFSDKPVAINAPFSDQVIALNKKGFSSDIIAAKLKATMAEVDLVLSLEAERIENASRS